MENKDPFKVDFKSGENKTADNKEIVSKETEQKEAEKPAVFSRRELRKQKKKEKELKRIAERKFEREAGLLGVKKTSLTLGIVGFIISTIPIILVIGALLLFLTCGLITVFLFLLFLVGFLIIAPIYLAGGNSLDNYFAFPLAPANFASNVFNTVTEFSGALSVVLAVSGLIMEIISLILLFVSYKALCKRNRIKRTVFLVFALVFTIIVLLFSLNGLNIK